MESRFIGKVCMFRTYSAGVHFGELVEMQDKKAIVKDSRRVYYWEGACSLSQLSNDGSKNISSCKIAQSLDEILLTEVIEVIPMRSKAIESLNSAKNWEV